MTVRLSCHWFPAASKALTVTVVVPASSARGKLQVVVPWATPLWLRSVAQVTLVTPTRSWAVPPMVMDGVVVL
jgi:hypothetical protein